MSDYSANLLERIVSRPPDPEAWRTLVHHCRAEHENRADRILSSLLTNQLTSTSPEARLRQISELADLISATEALGLTVALASEYEDAARHLALELIARHRGPLPEKLLHVLRGLFLDRRLPETPQLEAAAAVLRSVAEDEELGEGLIRTLVSGLGKARSIERLRKLERLAGKTAVVDALCERLEERLRMSCPRCELELRRPEMLRHLWEAHRLLLTGRRVREPWALIEDWIDAWKGGGPADLPARCRNLALHLDGEQGLRKVNRLILTRGGSDAEAIQSLLETATEQGAALCPRCFGCIAAPAAPARWELTSRRGRLSTHGFLVEVSERGLRTRLKVRTPARQLYVGPEPLYHWTFRGALFAFAGPFVLLALACAIGVVEWIDSPLSPVIFCLSLALLAYGCVRWNLRDRPPPARRAMTYAWTVLAPRLHEDGFDREGASFLAALARADGEEGAEIRAASLPRLIQFTEAALARGEAAPSHLAALRWRQIADAVSADVEAEVAALVGRCFEGKLPLAFIDCLLAEWRQDGWTPGKEARLRIVLCDRAFAAGFEVAPLVDAGQTAPLLGAVLRVNRPDALAALRLLWSLRPSRPWDGFGAVQTAFDLAADPALIDRLGKYDDLLFWQTSRDWPRELDEVDDEIAFRLAVRASGLMVQDALFEEAPATIRLKGHLGGTDLIVGGTRFRSRGNLEEFAERVEQWSSFFFARFRPKLDEVRSWKTPDKEAVWRAWGAVKCPECGKPSLPRVGELAVALDGE